jgi:hypothetical protein
MIAVLPCVFLFVLCVFLFFRECKLERNRFVENHRLANEHVLREAERFAKFMEGKSL